MIMQLRTDFLMRR